MKFLIVGLLILTSVWIQVNCQSESDEGESSDATNNVNKEETSTIKVTSKRGSKTARLLENLDKIKDRLEKSREVIIGIIDSFMGRGDEVDDEKLEAALSKYDEIIEDIEADFTKAKINLGLRVEGSFEQLNQTLGSLIENLRDINPDFADWAMNKRIEFASSLKRRLYRFNDFLGKTVERLLEMSEMGKTTLRRLYKRRYEKREKLSRIILKQRKQSDQKSDSDSES